MAPRTKMGATVTAQVIRGDDGAFNVERDATGVPIMREWKRGRGDTWSWHRKPAKGEAYLTWLNNAMQEFDADGDVSVFFSSGEYPDRRYIPDLDSIQPGERAMPLQPDAMPGAVQYDNERPARRAPTQQPSATSGATARKIDHIQAVIDDVPDAPPGVIADNLQFINPDGSIPLRDRVLLPGTEEWQDWMSANLTDSDLRDPDMPKVVRDAASAPTTASEPPQFRPNRNAPRDEFSGLLDDLANEEARVSPIDVTESRYSDADGAPKSFRPSPRGRGLFPEAEDVFKSGQNLPPDADAPPLYRRRPGRATIAGGVAALGGLGLGVALDQMMRQRQERNQVATDDRMDMATPEIEAMYRAEADRIYAERLGRPQEQIQQSIDELAESVTGVPASEMPRGTKWWRHPGMTADDRVALTELTGEMRVSREKWRSVPPGVSDADVIQATREESIAQARENVDGEMTARAEERARQPRPAPTPDAPLVSEPDPPRVETPEPETPRAETPDRTPVPDEPDTPRRRWRGRGLGGVALATAGGLGLGYALRDMMAQWQENRTDMAPLPAIARGAFEEGHRNARNIFNRMLRQGQGEDEARLTATRWVKENMGVDVQWPEAPGFSASGVRGGSRSSGTGHPGAPFDDPFSQPGFWDPVTFSYDTQMRGPMWPGYVGAGLLPATIAGGTGVAYAAGRLSHDPDPTPEMLANIEAAGWPIPQAYRAGRGAGDQSRFKQPRQDMAPLSPLEVQAIQLGNQNDEVARLTNEFISANAAYRTERTPESLALVESKRVQLQQSRTIRDASLDSYRQARGLEEALQLDPVRIETVEASTGYRIGKPFHTRVVSGNEIVESRLFATQEEADAAMKGFQEKYGVTPDAPETARAPDTAPPPEPEVRRNAPENVVDEPQPARYIDEEPPPRAAPEPETPPQRLRRRLRSGSARGNIIAGATVGALGLGAVLATELNRRRTPGSTPEGV